MQQQDVYFKSFAKNGTANKAPDELDILNLIQKALAFIGRFRFILFGFALLGLAFGCYKYFSSPNQSRSKLILHSSLLTNQEAIDIIEGWDGLLAKGQQQTLAGITHCSEASLKKLSTLSAEEVQKTYVQNNPNGLTVTVTVTDNAILDELQQGIVYGLNNLPYVKEKIAARRARFSQVISDLKIEIEKLNATKRTVDNMIASRNAGSSALMVDISRLNTSWVELNEKLLAYQEDLKFLTGAYVLEGFHKGKMGRSLLKPLVFGLAAGCFLGYLTALFLSIWQRLKRSETNYSVQ